MRTMSTFHIKGLFRDLLISLSDHDEEEGEKTVRTGKDREPVLVSQHCLDLPHSKKLTHSIPQQMSVRERSILSPFVTFNGLVYVGWREVPQVH